MIKRKCAKLYKKNAILQKIHIIDIILGSLMVLTPLENKQEQAIMH
jgi:hypothetical protein